MFAWQEAIQNYGRTTNGLPTINVTKRDSWTLNHGSNPFLINILALLRVISRAR